MFAVVQVGSSQYKVSEGDVIDTQLLEGEENESIHLDKILLFASGSDIRIGRPFLKDVTVEAQLLNHHLGEKVLSFKYRRRKNSSWKKGHRQRLTSLTIKKITAR